MKKISKEDVQMLKEIVNVQAEGFNKTKLAKAIINSFPSIFTDVEKTRKIISRISNRDKTPIKKRERALVFGCIHFPFQHPNAVAFLKDTFKRYNCTRIISTGDLIDSHAINFHDSDPDGYSDGDEIDTCIRMLKPLVKAFPKMDLIYGNHCRMTERQGQARGLSRRRLRSLNEIYELPETWKWHVNYTIKVNGHPMSIKHEGTANKLAENSGVSHVCSHLHTVGHGGIFHVTEFSRCWGAQTGCLMDGQAYAMAYAKDFKKKPMLGGVVTDGLTAQYIPMEV